MTRRHPNLAEKLACVTLELLELRFKLYHLPPEYRIPYKVARTMTAKEINARVRFDHGVHAIWGGDCHPTNLTARLVALSREHTRKVDVPQITKVKRIARKRDKLMPIDVTGALGDELNHTADARRTRMAQLRKAVLGNRPMPCARKSKYKRTMRGKTVLR